MHICICIHILNVSILIHTSICTAFSDIFYLAEASFVPKTLNRVHNKLQCILNVNGIFREKKTLKKTTLIYPQIFKFSFNLQNLWFPKSIKFVNSWIYCLQEIINNNNKPLYNVSMGYNV